MSNDEPEKEDHQAALVAAIVARLGDIDSASLLKSLSERALAAESGVHKSTVRRAFLVDGESEKIDRATMFVAAVEWAVAEQDAVSRENNRAWVRACERLDAGDGLLAFAEVMAEDLEDFVPAGDPSVDHRERILRLAFALADSEDPRDKHISKALGAIFDSYGDQYGEAYEGLFRAFDRRLADGVELSHLQTALYAVLDHAAVLARIGREIPPEVHLDMMFRVFWAYTTRNGEEDRHPLQELLAATRGGLGPTAD